MVQRGRGSARLAVSSGAIALSSLPGQPAIRPTHFSGAMAPRKTGEGLVMATNDDMEREGALTKAYRLWRVDGMNEFVAVVAEADAFEEIKRVRRRADWRYQATRNGRLIDVDTGFPILTLPGQDLTLRE